MLNAGVDRDSLRNLKEEQLTQECGIANSIHRLKILDTIKGEVQFITFLRLNFVITINILIIIEKKKIILQSLKIISLTRVKKTSTNH